jgi:hypothetical protein
MPTPWTILSPIHGKFVKYRTDVAVACFASGIYAAHAKELMKTFTTYNPDIRVFVFTDESEIGSPKHQENPYAFKYHAIRKVHAMGYPIVLWCDSILKLQKSIEPLIQEVSSVGVYLQDDIWKTGQFANDRCLEYFGVTRDEAMNIQSIWACFMGFDFRSSLAIEFMNQWKAAMDAGIFKGRHQNTGNTESRDPRCLGHRHDQSCAELISYQMKLPHSLPCLHPDPNFSHIYFVGRGW